MPALAWQYWALGGAILGAIIGSFVATLVLRWPVERSVLAGRSACDTCGRTLRVGELIPLLSIAVQRGRCRVCGAAIDPLHWQIELACALAGCVAFGVAPGLAGIAGALFGWTLIALITLDLRHFWLPDKLTLALALSGLAAGLAGLTPSLSDRIYGGVAGYLSLALIAISYRHLRGREGLGGGDPKLLGAIGLWLGWQALPLVVLGGSGAGLLWVTVRALRGNAVSATDHLPLGALLGTAAFPVWIAVTSGYWGAA